MLGKIATASFAAATLGVAALGSPAESRPFYYPGGGYHYWHGGWGHHGGDWNDGWGWDAAGLIGGLALSPLLFGNGYGYGHGYGYGNGYGYHDGGYYDGPACSWQTIKVHTRYPRKSDSYQLRHDRI